MPLPDHLLVLRDFLFVEIVQTNCIMTNGGPNIAGARCLWTSNSVATNLASNLKQAEQHDNEQPFSVSMLEKKKFLRFGWLRGGENF